MSQNSLSLNEISKTLSKLSTLLELSGANPFKVRAFKKAIDLVDNSDLSSTEFLEQATSGKIKGIGKGISQVLVELEQNGEVAELKSLEKDFPQTIFDVLEIPGLGVKKVKLLFDELDVDSLQALEEACKEQKLRDLKGFSEKTEEKLLKNIKSAKEHAGQFLYRDAYTTAHSIIKSLKRLKLADELEIAGSLRRGKEVVKDIDLVASSKQPKALMEAFCQLEDSTEVVAHGETKSAIRHKSGISVDLRVVDERDFAATLLHFSGSKQHNTLLRSRALKMDYKLSEYGLENDSKKTIKPKSEKELYKKLNLCWIPPELREGQKEVDKAESLFKEKREFPELLKESDIKGIFHNHSTWSDGKHSIEEMAKACIAKGYEYLGLSDHSKTASYAGGLKEEEIKKQHAEIDKLNESLAPFKIFKGIESDILADGSLDYSDKVLSSFDFIVASIHSGFNMSKVDMTARVKKAVANPYTTILGHPTGRLLLKREAYEIELAEIIQEAAKHGVSIELNANPKRLDLDWRFINKAQELGVKIPICPDAHSTEGISNVTWGVVAARKGGLLPENVPNTWSLAKVEKWLEAKK